MTETPEHELRTFARGLFTGLETAASPEDARIVRRETPHRHLLCCSGCGAVASVPRRNEWRDRG